MKKNIVFINTDTCLWDALKSIFYEFASDPNYNTYLVADNTFFFRKLNIQSFSLKDFDISRLSPDIIFRDTPYCERMPENIKGSTLTNIPGAPKICHIPYTMLIGVVEKLYFAHPFFNLCWKVFIDSEKKKNIFGNFYDRKTLDDKFIVSGYPKHDEYISNRELDLLWGKKKKSEKKRVFWAPHWSVTNYLFEDARKFNYKRGYSTFLKYNDFFLKILVKYRNIDFILRPHPTLFKRLSSYNHMTEAEVNSFIDEFNSHENGQVISGGDYMGQFIISNAMITDCCSFIGEYLPSKKPVLHLWRDDNPGYNNIGQSILNSYYKAKNEEDIDNFLTDVVINEEDPMLEERIKSAKSNLFLNPMGVGKYIKEYIDEEFRKDLITKRATTQISSITNSITNIISMSKFNYIVEIGINDSKCTNMTSINDTNKYIYHGIDTDTNVISRLNSFFKVNKYIKYSCLNYSIDVIPLCELVIISNIEYTSKENILSIIYNASCRSKFVILNFIEVNEVIEYLPAPYFSFKDNVSKEINIYQSEQLYACQVKIYYPNQIGIISKIENIFVSLMQYLKKQPPEYKRYFYQYIGYIANDLNWERSKNMIEKGGPLNNILQLNVLHHAEAIYMLSFGYNREILESRLPDIVNHESSDMSYITKMIATYFLKAKV